MSPGTSKEDFLQMVRQALGKELPTRRAPDYAPLKTPLLQQAQKVDTILARVEARLPQLRERFVEMAEKGGWRVARAATPREAADHIAAIVREKEATLVVRSEEPVFHRIGVDSALRRAGVAVTVVATRSEASRADLRRAVEEAQVGITGVSYAIAETGTCVLLPRKGLSRLVSLVPPVHIALVEPANLVETLDDVFAIQRLAYLRSRGVKSSYMSFITGPSRSGDIEQTITVGVHGPREAHCVLLGDFLGHHPSRPS